VRGTEISSEFGLRPNPFGRGYEIHAGLDFTAAYGSPVYGTAPGTVVKAGWSAGGYGNHVVVEHGYGYRTLYAHMSALKATVGRKVERNTILGYLGNTGRSSGPHLHYSVYHNDEAVDPKNYLE
jgi:murein DD-endopeptidase MepM/ murein hydrolase activator NlpD